MFPSKLIANSFRESGRKTAPRQGIHVRSRSSSFGISDLINESMVEYSGYELDSWKEDYTLKTLPIAPAVTENISSEKYFKEWWLENFKDYKEPKYEIKVQSQSIDAFHEMAPFITSEHMIPYFCLLNKKYIPLLWIEIHSGRSHNSYANTIASLVCGLILQFRFLRLLNQNTFNSISGFVFPNLTKKRQVALIRVEWIDLQFRIYYEYLDAFTVIDQVQTVLEKQDTLFKDIAFDNPPDYFLALSDSDLKYLKEEIPSDTPLKQCESHYSILVKNDSHYYKYIPYSKFEKAVNNFAWKRSVKDTKSIAHLVLPEHVVIIEPMLLFQFAAQPHQPLSRDEARKCIRDFVIQAKRALQELHKIGYAHVDVRLPNFCFSKDFEAMLIDFDRIQSTKNRVPSFGTKGNTFFIPPESDPTYIRLDFKQLGMLISSTLDLHPESLAPDDFISHLIEYGDFNKDLFSNWKTTDSTVKEILLERLTP